MGMSPRLMRPRATGFTPKNVSGLVQWYDAADQSTMTLNGTTVSEWRSKVGGVSVSQATAAAQPTLTTGYYKGLSALSFDGGDVLSNASLSMQISGMTIAAVFDETTRVAFSGVLVGMPSSGTDNQTVGGFRLSLHEGVNKPADFYAALTASAISAPSPTVDESSALGKRVVVVRVGPSNGTTGSAVLSYDGSLGAEDTLYVVPSNTTGTLIGGRFVSGAISELYRFNGKILEVAVWNRSITTNEMQQVQKYASQKWGTSAV